MCASRPWSLLVSVPLIAVAPALALTGASAGDPPDSTLAVIKPAAIRAHMAFLADDLLEGRGTGSRGYQVAARYVAAQLEALGLEPAGADGSYFQSVPLRRIELVRDQTWLELVRDGMAEQLVQGRDFVATGHAVHTDTQAEALLVFAGYGVSAPELGYDDYAGVDVRDKIVVWLSDAPPRFGSAERAHFSAAQWKFESAARRGAIGSIRLSTEASERRLPWAKLTRLNRQPGHRWLDPQGEPNNARPELRVGAALSLEQSRALFRGAQKTFEQVVADAEQSRPQAFDLSVSARMRRVSRHQATADSNVVAVLRGSDPNLRDEYVVFTAHLDHEGVGEPRDGDPIYNGAYDNANGVAQMLEAAHAFASLPQPPRRSVLFLAVCAEEEGLLGSDYFANYPTVPAASIVADINLDGGLLLYRGDVVVHGADHSTLGVFAREAAQRLGIELSPDPNPEQNFFIRSDQYSFIKKGVPAVFVFPGVQSADPGVDGAKRMTEYLTERYHTPQDDMSQSFDFAAAALGARFNFLIGYAVAQQEGRPRWNPGDFFGKTFGGETN